MNWVDLAILAVAAISGVLGLMRGFVRESLGLGAWVGAGYVSIVGAPLVRGQFETWLGSPEIADAAAYAAVFVIVLIVFSMIAGWIGSVVHAAGLGGVDRSLGALFGLVRGGGLIVVAYIIGSLLMPADRWPEPLRQARLMPQVAEAAQWLAARLPASYRPNMPGVLTGRDPRALDLMQAPPQGRARP